ncbi:MAG: CRISPR-associated endonuclease Cas2 [Deltaproteobacteria bacterium]|nr:CRISPR-associated endonuclease Cas2 [Deltaproteobacteria bacterium]
MKKFIVIAYDIENNKKRREAASLLEAMGIRVNKSVFECFISKAKLEKLQAALDQLTAHGDTVLYYTLCKSCIERIDRRGIDGLPNEAVKVF